MTKTKPGTDLSAIYEPAASPAPGALADLRVRYQEYAREPHILAVQVAWSLTCQEYVRTLLASSPAALAPPVDGGGHLASRLEAALAEAKARTAEVHQLRSNLANTKAAYEDALAALARHAAPDGEKTEAGDAMLTALHSEIAHSVTCPANPALSGLAEASNRMAGRWLRRDPMAPIERSVQVSAKKASNRILLHSGNCFDLLAPEASTFTIEDIAHGLSNVCRFAGQCTRFYSVAQHSVLVSQHVPPEHAYAGLMHDAAEALIGDVSKPLKEILPDYQALEKRIEAAVCSRFDVPYPLSEEVKRIDMIMLATEQHLLMPDREGRSFAGGHTPLDIDIPLLWPHEAEALFLRRYAELRGHELPAITRSDIPQGEARARIGGRVPEHVYLDGKPLFTAASAEQAAEVVALLNATPQGAGETAGGVPITKTEIIRLMAKHWLVAKGTPPEMADEISDPEDFPLLAPEDWWACSAVADAILAALATAAPEQAGSSEIVRIDYTNYRGERSIKVVTPGTIFWGANEYHQHPQWLMHGYDHEKKADRVYAVRDIHAWNGVPTENPTACED